MKKLGKFLLVGVGGFIALVIVIAILTGGQDKTNELKVKTVPVSKEVVTEEEEVVKKEDKTGVTLENFNKLETGMTYEEVVIILGSEGETLSESEIGGIKTVMHMWEGNAILSNMNVMTQNNELISKAQVGLE